MDKAVGILAFLSSGGPANLAGVVEGTRLSRPTAHRLLSALETHHLVSRRGGGYVLGARLLGWGAGAVGADFVEGARPVLERLRDRVGESAQLYVRDGESRVCVASVERVGGGLRDAVPVGAVMPLDRGSAGKVLLAWSGNGATGKVSTGELDDIKERGWAESVAEREAGVASVSAPVFGPGGELLAVISASGPISRLGEHPGERLAEGVVAAARELEGI